MDHFKLYGRASSVTLAIWHFLPFLPLNGLASAQSARLAVPVPGGRNGRPRQPKVMVPAFSRSPLGTPIYPPERGE